MNCRTRFLWLAIFILLMIVPFEVRASQISKEFSKIIGDFSNWKMSVENSIAFFKSSPKIPPREIQALKFMYIPVHANVNTLIDRMIFDLNQTNDNIDSERYSDSLIKAQHSVSDFNDYIEDYILPFTSEKKKGPFSEYTGLAGPLVVVAGIASLVGATLAVLDYLEKRAKKSEREKIIKALNGVKLKAFEEIRHLNIEKEE